MVLKLNRYAHFYFIFIQVRRIKSIKSEHFYLYNLACEIDALFADKVMIQKFMTTN